METVTTGGKVYLDPPRPLGYRNGSLASLRLGLYSYVESVTGGLGVEKKVLHPVLVLPP